MERTVGPSHKRRAGARRRTDHLVPDELRQMDQAFADAFLRAAVAREKQGKTARDEPK